MIYSLRNYVILIVFYEKNPYSSTVDGVLVLFDLLVSIKFVRFHETMTYQVM